MNNVDDATIKAALAYISGGQTCQREKRQGPHFLNSRRAHKPIYSVLRVQWKQTNIWHFFILLSRGAQELVKGSSLHTSGLYIAVLQN